MLNNLTESEYLMSFHLMAKLNGSLCNLNCKYCFYTPKKELFRILKWKCLIELCEEMIIEGITVKLAYVSGQVRDFMRSAGLEKYFGTLEADTLFMKLLMNLIKNLIMNLIKFKIKKNVIVRNISLNKNCQENSTFFYFNSIFFYFLLEILLCPIPSSLKVLTYIAPF